MIKTAEILQGNTLEALDKVHKLLHQDEITNVDALTLYLWLYRLGALTDMTCKALLPEANKRFDVIRTASADQKSWSPTGFAKLTNAAVPASWIFPASLVTEEAKLKAAKEKAKMDDSAKKQIGKINADTSQLFKVNLQVC